MEPAVAEPEVAEPDVAAAAVAEPAVAEPAVAEPAVAEPAVTEPEVAGPAVADHANGRPMLEVVADGLMMEILSWHTEVEEPTAAHTISQALNKGHAHRSPYD